MLKKDNEKRLIKVISEFVKDENFESSIGGSVKSRYNDLIPKRLLDEYIDKIYFRYMYDGFDSYVKNNVLYVVNDEKFVIKIRISDELTLRDKKELINKYIKDTKILNEYLLKKYATNDIFIDSTVINPIGLLRSNDNQDLEKVLLKIVDIHKLVSFEDVKIQLATINGTNGKMNTYVYNLLFTYNDKVLGSITFKENLGNFEYINLKYGYKLKYTSID